MVDPEFPVFLTYDPQDANLAGALQKALAEENLKSWSEEHDLVPGELWDEVIPGRLSEALVVVVIVSRRWPVVGDSHHDWYGPEKVALAIELSKEEEDGPAIVPVVINGTKNKQVPLGLRRQRRIKADENDLAPVAKSICAAVSRWHEKHAERQETRKDVIEELVALEHG